MSTKKRGRDFEANYLAMRRRMQSLGTAVIPAPATIGAHTHHAREIVSDPFDITAADDVQEAIEELTSEKLARDGSQTMLGNLDFNTFKIYNLGALNFDTDTVVAAVNGGLQWSDAAGIERLVMRADGVDMPVGGVYLKVKNATGTSIAAGVPVVLVTGAAGNILTIELAADSMAVNVRMILGVTMQAIADGAKGWVCRLGYVGALDTSAFTDGLQLYVNGTGAMSGTIPSKGCSARIRMGMVIDAANPGSMWVDPDWRPDLDELANVSIGDYAPKQFFDVPMWLPTVDGEPCHNWRDFPAARLPAVDVSAAYEVDQDNVKDVVLYVTANAADIVITLPDLTLTFQKGRLIRVKKVGGAYKVDVQTSGTDVIDGTYTSVKLYKVGEVLDLQAYQFGGDPFWEIQ